MIRLIIFLTFISCAAFVASAQEKPDSIWPQSFDEKMPAFPGGNDSLHRFLSSVAPWNFINRDCPDSGKFVFQFVIDSTGVVVKSSILIGCSRAVNRRWLEGLLLIPKWEPATQNGKGVPIKYTVPFRYNLRG
jgi:periplasmic protein TonB